MCCGSSVLGAAAAGRCRQRAGCKQASTTSESEVEDEDKSSQYGDRRVHVEKAYSNSAKVSQHSSRQDQRLSSMHRCLNTINLAAARRSLGAGGHASCPHPCTRTSSRASSDFILCRCASNARALPAQRPCRPCTDHPLPVLRRPDRATTPPACRATPARP